VSHVASLLRRNARRALGEGRVEEAARIVERLKREAPLAVETRALELELLLRSGRHADAQVLASRLVERFPGSARVLYLAGRAAYLRRSYAEAEQLLVESARLEPHPWTRRLLGKALTQLGRLDDAEALLLELAPGQPAVRKDLAWLYERKNDLPRAVACLETHLAAHPEDAGARAQLRRVRAVSLDPGDLLAEVEGLLDLGEEVPENLWPAYCEAAFRKGRRDKVERFVRGRIAGLDARTATSVGWICYRMQSHDLAFDVFRSVFDRNRRDLKFLNAFEAAACRAGRLDDLVRLYRDHAAQEGRLYGRLKRLRRSEPARAGPG
jgi:tetratricopeptide (TPR) repeat protein